MKMVILDRDGVINFDSENYIKSIDEWKPIPNSLEAIAKLSQAGYKVVIATNQSGLGRGLFSIQDLDDMHQALQKKVQQLGGCIDAIFFCPHIPADDCDCRKPNAGLFKLIARYFHVNLNQVPAIGDAKRDIEASLQLDCQPILVCTGKGQHTLESINVEKILVYNDLHEAVTHLMNNDKLL